MLVFLFGFVFAIWFGIGACLPITKAAKKVYSNLYFSVFFDFIKFIFVKLIQTEDILHYKVYSVYMNRILIDFFVKFMLIKSYYK